MYIGPWQEYRLAKIQDDAIQRLRREWEAQLRGQLPAGDDDRIRELMQPLVAKLPSLLLAAKSRTNTRGESNQETHEERSARGAPNPPVPKPKKKGKKAPLTSLEQVQKRKKMFAKWIKQAGNNDAGGQRATVASPASSNAGDVDLDESVDEDEVNKLLNWTDTLLSPQAMDSLCDFDD
ncbi:hypothetical protein PHYSODRAFT_542426 [Phytophthora sojae]|uniref:Uncharacterized protein n=1 Tax=Phytophthora sojae (strain P6497) TaxID=1094619 RepID=G4Z248_PHYSP|nr:hypothetical protein PHYSODRAFT_542426 [Phytophthora sojae]EGZ21383.1 hypothetical protein PHYSODRAFT_542426 [Phytophthora sojae]|eukprot:XP_009524100.1 hypothetical protein PHYSODRAFT_542426 [Phytophthora sojae]